MSNDITNMLDADVMAAPLVDGGERSLIARAARGDAAAARALYDRHAARVFRLAYRMCGNQHLAADLTQDVFVRVFRQLGQFRGEAAFSTWLHRVAVTTCLNGLRRVRRLERREVDLDAAADQAAGGLAVDPMMRQALAAAIAELPETLRTVVVMHSLEGYTHAEIGAALGIAEGTSKSREHEARARLRAALGGTREG